jgi:hypothetical protein
MWDSQPHRAHMQRQWLYQNIPAEMLNKEQRNYFTPVEIDAILILSAQDRELLEFWETRGSA